MKAEKRRETQEERRGRDEAQRRGRKIAALTKQRDSSTTLIKNAVRRLENMEATLRGLQSAEREPEQEGRDPERLNARIERLQELIDKNRGDVDVLRERIADADRQLRELNGDGPAAQEPSQAPEALASEG